MMRDKLVLKRLEKGLTRKEVAQLSNMLESDYNIIENGFYRKISPTDYLKLKDVLSLDKEFEKKYVSIYNDLTVLKSIRESLGYSLDDVEKISGICRMGIWRIEKGITKKISKKVFLALAKTYGIKDRSNYDHLIICKSSIKIKFINDGKFGELVKEKRETLKLTQAKLASEASVNYSLVSKIEKLNRSVTVETAIKLMNVLNFTEEEKGRYLVKK